MSPLWVVQRFRPRFWDLVPFTALQLERRGYLVRIAHETVGLDQHVLALVVLAVRPRWRWLLELLRRATLQLRPARPTRFARPRAGGPHGPL